MSRTRLLTLQCLALLTVSCASAPPLRDAAGGRLDAAGRGNRPGDTAAPRRIATLERVRIGGADQWISVRGQDDSAPILLFLHGGPGSAEIPLTRKYFSGTMESRFVVVSWEQRGAGKSFRAGAPGTLTVDTLLSDTLELVDLLRARFHTDKVFILGHSWGSALGILFASAHPERVAAYGGIGQLVDGRRNEALSYGWTREQAARQGNRRAARQLDALSWYPADPLAPGWFKAIRTQRSWLGKMGGVLYGKKGYTSEWLWDYVSAPEYTPVDLVNWVRGNVDSIKAMWPEIIELNLEERVPRLEVPAAFFMGRADYNTPWPLAQEYFDMLQAPRKELVWFERSGHCPAFEEPRRFAEELVGFFLGHGDE